MKETQFHAFPEEDKKREENGTLPLAGTPENYGQFHKNFPDGFLWAMALLIILTVIIVVLLCFQHPIGM